ncbi:MAG: homoserine O-acetyltransferase [Nitrococcus sp.]|nr:homoserine O-acetyltransferase [Nitrococcus sp.]
MPESIPPDSVGLVEPEHARFNTALTLECGRSLPGYELVYEAYGKPNSDRSNAILICHALSGTHHAAGYNSLTDRKPGWWDVCIGPGKPIDTNRFYVVCCNNLGGCHGSTGPTSINPATGEPYGADFPIITVQDWVHSQARLADHLGIETWAAIAGGSLGAMQAMQWAIEYPRRLRHAIVIAAAPRLSAQNIAFNEVARQAIRSDPDFHDGRYQSHQAIPRRGLMLARMLGHITYLSDKAMRAKFGRDLRRGKDDYDFHYEVEFEVESYLRYQGESFVEHFDANTYLLMTKALDYFDPAAAFGGDLTKALAGVSAQFLVVAFTSDWRFSPARSREIVRALLDGNKDVTYAEIEADHGHDAFLMPVPQYIDVLGTYMDKVAAEIGA